MPRFSPPPTRTNITCSPGWGSTPAHIASSRTLDFLDTFREATDGQGMDVVLNSLAGEFVDASLQLLPRGGSFIEIGKTDIRAAGDIAAAHPGVDYQTYRLGQRNPRNPCSRHGRP